MDGGRDSHSARVVTPRKRARGSSHGDAPTSSGNSETGAQVEPVGFNREAVDWRNGEYLKRLFYRAKKFAEADLKMYGDAAIEVAQEAVTVIWERDRVGFILTEREVWPAVSERAYEIARQIRARLSFDARRHVSLSQSIGEGPDDDDRLSIGIWGHVAPDQIDRCYLSEITDAILLLPEKQREVMKLLAVGYNAPDISEHLRLPMHTVFARINDARSFIFRSGLLGVAMDNRHKRIKP